MTDSESVSFEDDQDISFTSADLEKMKVELIENDRDTRIEQEYKLAKSDKYISSLGCSFGRDDNNKSKINATIIGPQNTPFYGGFYKLEIEFKANYPESKPNVKFITNIYHPNVYKNGDVCIDILNNWKKNYSIVDIIEAIYVLLLYPNEISPANADAGKDIENDKKEEREKNKNPHTYEEKAKKVNLENAYPV